jgi:hypothetical protein
MTTCSSAPPGEILSLDSEILFHVVAAELCDSPSVAGSLKMRLQIEITICISGELVMGIQ